MSLSKELQRVLKSLNSGQQQVYNSLSTDDLRRLYLEELAREKKKGVCIVYIISIVELNDYYAMLINILIASSIFSTFLIRNLRAI